MPSLKEIKLRIESVKKTLKITSVMKLVAAAKLKKVQKSIANLLPYQKELEGILTQLPNQKPITTQVEKVLIIAISSNSSLCGAFNNNLIKGTKELIEKYLQKGIKAQNIYLLALGRKVEEFLSDYKVNHLPSLNHLCDHPDYKKVCGVVDDLILSFNNQIYDKVEIVYNHLHSSNSQPTTIQQFLPIKQIENHKIESQDKYIIEPNLEQVYKELFPITLHLQFYAILLDAISAEHSARMLAMQLASDNAKELVNELSLEYNKTRQQKITSEILDLVSASM